MEILGIILMLALGPRVPERVSVTRECVFSKDSLGWENEAEILLHRCVILETLRNEKDRESELVTDS